MVYFDFNEKNVTRDDINKKIESLDSRSTKNSSVTDGRVGSASEQILRAQNLPQPNKYEGVLYLINKTGKYYIDTEISSFSKDAFNLKVDHITLDSKNTSSIKAANAHVGAHRDAIQLIPSGGMHYAGYPLSNIKINNLKIVSSNVLSELQGLTAFDGLFDDIYVTNLEVDVQNENAVTFFGLRYAEFTNLKITGGGYITLNPLRLCGGGNSDTPSILITEPWIDNDGNEQKLYFENTYINVMGNIIDNRAAFSKDVNDLPNEEATLRLKNDVSSHGNTEVYSHLKIGTLWTEVLNSEPFKRNINTSNDDEIEKKSKDILKEIHKSVKKNARRVNV